MTRTHDKFAAAVDQKNIEPDVTLQVPKWVEFNTHPDTIQAISKAVTRQEIGEGHAQNI